MSTLWVAAIIIAITVIPPAIFIRLHSRAKRKRREALLAQFREAGAKHGLSFTHQEILKDKMLGLDASNQTLLLFAFDVSPTDTALRLADMETCTVYREYDQFSMDGNKNAKAEPVLTAMGLQIAFSNGRPSLPVRFYHNHVDGIYEIPELEKKVKEWKNLLSPQVHRKELQRA